MPLEDIAIKLPVEKDNKIKNESKEVTVVVMLIVVVVSYQTTI